MATVANGKQQALPESHTLYCSNLPDKLQKDDLRRALYMLFTSYGPVLDVVALKTPKMRGQAHVLFRDRESSASALRALQDHDFFGKPMKIQFAKSKSDTLAKLDGSYKQPTLTVAETETSAVQKSIFAGPPASSSGPPGVESLASPAHGLPPPPPAGSSDLATSQDPTTAQPAPAEDEEEGEDDAAMDMSDDD